MSKVYKVADLGKLGGKIEEYIGDAINDMQREMPGAIENTIKNELEVIASIAKGTAPKFTETLRGNIRVDGMSIIADPTVREQFDAMIDYYKGVGTTVIGRGGKYVGQQMDEFQRARRSLYFMRQRYGYIPFDKSYASQIQVDGENFMVRAINVWQKLRTIEYDLPFQLKKYIQPKEYELFVGVIKNRLAVDMKDAVDKQVMAGLSEATQYQTARTTMPKDEQRKQKQRYVVGGRRR